MAAPVCVGVLGCANIMHKNARALAHADGIEIVALGSRTLGKAEEAKASLVGHGYLSNKTACYGTYDEVLAHPGLHAVYIPLPSALHVEWVKKAAAKGLHIMLEKPVSVSSEDLDAIMGAVEAAGVQMFDGTMWMHNPRTARMRDIIRAPEFGQVVEVTSSFSFRADDAFFNSDVRMQPGGDPLGCLGDLGWYCIRAALFAFDFELPEYAAAHPGGTFNVHGVPSYLAFTLIWPRAAGARHPRRATITTGFDIPLTFTLDVKGTQQTLSVRDLVLPRSETESVFSSTRAHGLSDFQTPDITVTEEHVVPTPKSQEACMWEAFAGCVRAVRNEGRQPDRHWHAVARATQQVVLAVAASARQGCAPVAVANLSPARL